MSTHSTARVRSSHRPPSPAATRGVIRPASAATPSLAAPSLPIPITQSVSRPSSPHARPSRPPQIKPVSPAGAHSARDSILAQAIRHNDLRLLVENQERVRSAATSNSRPSSASRGPSRSRRTQPVFGAAALETDSEASGESIDAQIDDLRLNTERSHRLPSVARAAAAPSPARGPSTRRLSSLATYTGIVPGQAPVRSRSARTASPELLYSLPVAGRRISAPPTTPGLSSAVIAAPAVSKLERRLSTTAGRPPSPAPPGFKTSLRPLGATRAGLSPISPPSASIATRLPTSSASMNSRARSRSPAPRGLVRAASPSPTSQLPSARGITGSSSSTTSAHMTTRAASPAPASARTTGPRVIRGFDVSASVQSPHPQQQPPLAPGPSMSARTLGAGVRGSRGHHGAAGPIVRPASVLLDRTADQRLEVAASRDFERIDDYYASRYAAAEAMTQDGGMSRPVSSGLSSREQRLQKRAAEERLRRGYNCV